jgi:hypothetical protein
MSRRSFTGQLKQPFVVSQDNQGKLPYCPAPGPQKNERKCPLDGQTLAYDRSIERGGRGHGGARGKGSWLAVSPMK